MSQVTHLLVANPTAQSGKNAARIARARELLEAAGVGHRFLPTEPGGGTVGAVARALADPGLRVAISMGGDGTFAEVAKGILQSGRAGEVALAMLPTGTANDQGKSFGLGAEPEALEVNVGVIARGRECRLDAGRIRALDRGGRLVREDHFFDSAGWGLSPRVLALRNEDREAIARLPVVREVYRDHLVYAGALLRTFLASYVEDDKFDALAIVDGQVHEWRGLTDFFVKGTRFYGGMWIFAPDSEPDDGLMEVVPFVGRRDWTSKVLVHLEQTGALAEGLAAVGVRHSRSVRGAQIELELRAHTARLGLAAQIDGEEFPATEKVKVEVLPRALRLVVPEAYARSY